MSRISPIIATQLDLDETEHTNAKRSYEQSVAAARGYDGTEDAEHGVYATAVLFESCAREIAQRRAIDVGDPFVRDAVEQAVARAIAPDEPALSVQGFLELAIESLGHKLDAGTAVLLTIETDLHFLPTHGTTSIVRGDDVDPLWEVRVEPRTAQLIKALNQNGIYADDIVLYKGMNVPRVMRQRPYTLIQIPRLDREILICDAAHQATFIGIGQRGPEYWATHGKEQLAQDIGIIRLTNHGDWLQRTIQILFDANPPQPKRKLEARLFQRTKLRLTEELILNKALEFAMSHDGNLPERNSGQVEGYPTETWSNWSTSVRNQANGLTREGLTGLVALFRLYKLVTIGTTKNPLVIKMACESLRLTGSHGLVAGNDFRLTEDVILQMALEYTTTHDGRLPTKLSGEVHGLPGQTWGNWDASLISGLHGLQKSRGVGLSGLFRIYGLKIAKIANPEAIKRGLTNTAKTGAHGLKVVGETILSEDLIFRCALEYAEKHDGKLSSKHTGAIEGYPGQEWTTWDSAVRNKSNGLTREGMSGLADLFRTFALKNRRVEDPVAVQKAIETLKATGNHGLKAVGAMQLTEDLILRTALEYAVSHNNRLPTPMTGEIDGFPGQTWANWHSAVIRASSGLTHPGLNGLPNLFRAYGLKLNRKSDTKLIQQSWAQLKRDGHHGLVFDATRIKHPGRPADALQKTGPADQSL